MSIYDEGQINVFMRLALDEARAAYDEGEVPVGAVLVWEGRVISSAHNTRENGKNALHHAELKVINDACKTLGGWRLHKGALFVTLEPCVMCAGACVNARIKEVYYGAPDIRAGGFGGVLDVRDYPLNHKPLVTGGIAEEESSELLQSFFKQIRDKRDGN